MEDKELQEAYKKRLQEVQQQGEREKQVKQLLQKCLAPDALERLSRIKLSDERLYESIVQQVLYFFQSNQLNEKISDDVLKNLASQLSQKRETKIEFLRK